MAAPGAARPQKRFSGGVPYTLFGESKETIKSKYSQSEIWLDEDDEIAVNEENNYLKLSHFYHFKNNKLQYIVTMSYHELQTNKYFGQYQDYMVEYAAVPFEERIKVVSSYMYLYNRNNDYYIGLKQLTGNIMGWYAYYAKTKDELKYID